jgi:seryl-tRNA synthetase
MTNWHDHVSRLSHVGGLPRGVRQQETSDELRAEIEQLRKARNERRDELQALREQYATEKRRQTAELAAERAAHDAKLAAERDALKERARQLDEVLRAALEAAQHRTPAISRQMAMIEEALRAARP